MTNLAPPDPATRKAVVRDRPYGGIVDRLFDRETSSAAERNLYRWLYRNFRRTVSAVKTDGETVYVSCTAFAARAMIVSASFKVEDVERSMEEWS